MIVRRFNFLKIGMAFLAVYFYTGNAHALQQPMPKVIQQLINELVKEQGFERKALSDIFKTANITPSVVEAIRRPAENLAWHRYKELFVTPTSARNGAEFWLQHQEVLERAEQQYGVPAEVIVAIIGVETRYGKYMGKHRVLDSLTTLTLKYPKRSRFFRRELKEFLVLGRDENLDVKNIKGSYAGAMGVPQFISSSYRHYAVDFNNDDVRDLIGQPHDAIGSVANYLKSHKWRRGGATTLNVKITDPGKTKWLINRELSPNSTVQKIVNAGVKIDGIVSTKSPAGLIRLEDKKGAVHRLALNNFYVITRYNRSINYAMAVVELSRAIAEKMAKANQPEQT